MVEGCTWRGNVSGRAALPSTTSKCILPAAAAAYRCPLTTVPCVCTTRPACVLQPLYSAPLNNICKMVNFTQYYSSWPATEMFPARVQPTRGKNLNDIESLQACRREEEKCSLLWLLLQLLYCHYCNTDTLIHRIKTHYHIIISKFFRRFTIFITYETYYTSIYYRSGVVV